MLKSINHFVICYSLWPMLTQVLHVCVLGVSLTDDEADNTQGSRYCLVAIGRLQVRWMPRV